jgi:hypothetical protein
MTSWSLTLLFIHLWLSAFIALYFYSIDKKSCLSTVFSFLFGPFSCSRSKQQQLEIASTSSANTSNNNNNDTNETFITRVTKCFKGKSKSQSNYKLDKNVSGEEVLQESFISNKPNEIKINMALSSNLSVEKSQEQVVILPENYDERLEKTYCSNKSKCQLPSSKIIVSDTASWQLWIDVHVPTFILILMKISWLLYNLIVISAILVTIGYFTYVNLNGLKMEPTWITEIGNLHRHGVNSLVAVVDVVSLFTFYLFLTMNIN